MDAEVERDYPRVRYGEMRHFRVCACSWCLKQWGESGSMRQSERDGVTSTERAPDHERCKDQRTHG